MMQPLISVIVPVYKTEKYLDRCVQSIAGQTYENLEIILVDDGSPDNCGSMCDAWAKKDSRIRVIHKENGGLSDARNAGMAAATGEYIGFVDSDDFIRAEMYQLLRENMAACDSDISACGVELVDGNGKTIGMLTRSGNHVMDTCDAMAAVVAESWLKQPVWYKLYKTVLVRDIPFPAGKYHEDVFWTYRAIGKAKRVSVFDAPCYCYTQRSGSIMGAQYSLKRLDGVEAKRERHEYITVNFPELAGESLKDLWYTCIYQGQLALLGGDKTQVEKAMQYLRLVMTKHPGSFKRGSVKDRLWLRMAKVSLKGTCRIRNWLRVGF